MTEPLCSVCKLFGKPPERVNFIIVASSSDSLIPQRIKHILKKYSDESSFVNDVHLKNYEALIDIKNKIFPSNITSLSDNQATSTETRTCCNGLIVYAEIESFRQRILKLLTRNSDITEDESDKTSESPSWVIFTGQQYFEPAVLKILLQLKNEESNLFDYTCTVLGFLMNEQTLFKHWYFQDRPIQDYQTYAYPEYESAIKEFFSFLNSSKELQQITLLIDEDYISADEDLQFLLQSLFSGDLSNCKAVDNQLRLYMSGLLLPRRRTVRDISYLRNDLQKYYASAVKRRLSPLLTDLKQSETAIQSAREICRIVLDEFDHMNDEENRVYKRQLMLGLNNDGAKSSNTVAAQLVFCALRLLESKDESLYPLIYAIVMSVCRLSGHYIFRHELFNNTLQIYTLGLLLVTQREYSLVLCGLRLCASILDGDQIEHKYALAFAKHDSLAVRKILDAVKWILSAYIYLKDLWRKEVEETKPIKDDDNDDSETTGENLMLYKVEKASFEHTRILVARPYIKGLASLLYGSTDHCVQVTENDVQTFAEVIEILTDSRMICRTTSETRSRSSCILVSHICSLLIPIFIYGTSTVNTSLLKQVSFLRTLPRTIYHLLESKAVDESMVNVCIEFYTLLVQSTCQKEKLADTKENEESSDESEAEADAEDTVKPVSSVNPRDLISSYFDLQRNLQQMLESNKESMKNEQIQRLFQDEWKKSDIFQLQQKYEELERETQSLKETLSQTRNELQRTQLEKDQFRKDNMRMAQEIDHLKTAPNVTKNVEVEQSTVIVSTNNNTQENTVNELENLAPNEITKEQAEKCIREIYHRRTTFNDPDMRKSICGSLKHLGSDLYSSRVHFLHELIQNAEDNSYDSTITPCLRIELHHNYILFSNNERGLRARDVLAICSLAVSTKTMQQELIGEKGVGFKSVFAASNQPMLFSHAWKFRFQVSASDAMSYITPLWIADPDIPDCISNKISAHTNETHLYLPLKLQAYTTETESFLNQVATAADPCILLNMRHLKKLEIIDERENKVTTIEKQLVGPTKLENQSNLAFEGFSFNDLSGSLVKLCTRSGYNTFRVYTCFIEIPTSMEQRRSPKSRLLLAFPCELDYNLTSTVYTGLPVCDLGFNFLFNADFQLVTSRENVRENAPLNTFIRDHLATLFVYLLLNDFDLKKDIHRYCPTTNIHQLRHSSWWLSMVDNINSLITKYLPVLFDIHAGKTMRQFNTDLALLISNEQLYNCADIQVIKPDADFLTAERLKSFQIQSVSVIDVLNCFPDRDDTESKNKYRHEFLHWTSKQNETWWAQLFNLMTETMATELANTMLQKPIFLLKNNQPQRRQYLPDKIDGKSLLLFLSDDLLLVMWKRQLTLVYYASDSEKTALLKSNHIQHLTVERFIDIIRLDHLQLSTSLPNSNVNIQLTEEIWKDLSYLKSHIDKLDKSTPFLVPTDKKPKLTIIQNAILPTILGVDIREFMYPTELSSIIGLPYPNVNLNQLENKLQWEHFLLEMNCQRSSIHLADNCKIIELPFLPLLTTFPDVQCAQLAQQIFTAQNQNTKDCLRQFPVLSNFKNDEQICSISATFDEILVRDLPSLPSITIPTHCRALAIDLGVCVEYDLRTCVTILQLLTDEKNTNIDLYIQWLGRLQLYVRQQHENFQADNLLDSCKLYLPDQQNFYSLKNLLVTSGNEEHRHGTLLVAKYLQLQWISPTINQVYWQFKDLFRFLKCTCEIAIDHVYETIYQASRDKTNFFSFGNCKTTLTENGRETIITLYEYLEYLILKSIQTNTDNELYKIIVENKHPSAPCGSPVDFEWRFRFTCNSLSKRLRKLIHLDSQSNKLSLPTIDQRLVNKTKNTIVYACLETKIIQDLSKEIGKRYYILPSIARTCPLVMSAFEIDYVERCGKVLWDHTSHNMESRLTQLTDIFRHVTKDSELEVVSAKYAGIYLILSDSNENQDESTMKSVRMDNQYPFWIFKKTVLLCIEFVQMNESKAIVATSALATILHKRNHMPFEEAKSMALHHVTQCREFRSNNNATVACAEATSYSYIDLLFPTDHHSIESLPISIGNRCTIEQDTEEFAPEPSSITSVAADRMAEDRVYRDHVKTQNHTRPNDKRPSGSANSMIVDSIKEIRIGQNAEHFFFTYLQHCYGSEDVTPVKNWRSSSRLAVYPQFKRNIDDSAGYDFELHDTREVFTRGTGSTTKYCYFEVKGTSGTYNEQNTSFHVSQNELEKCEAIATNKTRNEREAYFIVIIENCLDLNNIFLARVLEW